MSKPWNPNEDLARVRQAPAGRAWPEGATAGLVMVAAGCVALVVVLYQLSGPRDVFAP